ncbi:hypothetical protein BC827DRAFT_1385651 [Russula dissimulans]|nr:hypothetical protein BC827DRAFT_1385651 [Russula dissimulans]
MSWDGRECRDLHRGGKAHQTLLFKWRGVAQELVAAPAYSWDIIPIRCELVLVGDIEGSLGQYPIPSGTFKFWQEPRGSGCWRWQVERKNNQNEEEPCPPVSRATTSNLFRLITGHAFTGQYAARFLRNKFPQLSPDELEAFPCGANPQTVEHVLRTCPTFDEARRKLLYTGGRVRSLNQLFEPPHCTNTLQFLEETQACARPRNVAWDPGGWRDTDIV